MLSLYSAHNFNMPVLCTLIHITQFHGNKRPHSPRSSRRLVVHMRSRSILHTWRLSDPEWIPVFACNHCHKSHLFSAFSFNQLIYIWYVPNLWTIINTVNSPATSSLDLTRLQRVWKRPILLCFACARAESTPILFMEFWPHMRRRTKIGKQWGGLFSSVTQKK